MTAQRRPRRRTSCARHDRARLRAHRDRLGADLVRRDARDLHRLGRRSPSRAGWPARAAAGSRPSTGCCPPRRATASSATSRKGRPDGRTVEIQRLIGRSLRGVIDFEALGERTIYVDCDVLQADGGTRCASITGGYVALELALPAARSPRASCERSPLTGTVAAVSCGIVDGVPLLDLDYPEDSTAEVDANVVMTGEGGLVEVQATAERTPLSRAHLDELLALAADRHRGAARGRRTRAPSRERREARARHAQRAQAPRVRAAAAGRTSSSRCPTGVAPPPETGDTFADNALIKARAPRRPPAARDRRRLGHRGRGARRRARRPLRPLRRRTPPTRRTSTSCAREAPPAAGCRYVCVIAYVDADGDEHALRGPLRRARWPRSPRGERRLRLRPGVPARRRRRAHDGRAVRRREGRDLPPRPRRARAAGMAHALSSRPAASREPAPAAARRCSRSSPTRC